MNKKKVIVIGASTDISRYSNKAVRKLLENDFEVIAVGNKEGTIEDIKILTEPPLIDNVYGVTLYIAPGIQKLYYDYIIKIKPGFIFFNPGTYNEELINLAKQNNINTLEGCTLVALSIGDF